MEQSILSEQCETQRFYGYTCGEVLQLRDALRLAEQALERVDEWVMGDYVFECLWCKFPRSLEGHHLDTCPRQMALDAIKKLK